jgi:hypothetical protein
MQIASVEGVQANRKKCKQTERSARKIERCKQTLQANREGCKQIERVASRQRGLQANREGVASR